MDVGRLPYPDSDDLDEEDEDFAEAPKPDLRVFPPFGIEIDGVELVDGAPKSTEDDFGIGPLRNMHLQAARRDHIFGMPMPLGLRRFPPPKVASRRSGPIRPPPPKAPPHPSVFGGDLGNYGSDQDDDPLYDVPNDKDDCVDLENDGDQDDVDQGFDFGGFGFDESLFDEDGIGFEPHQLSEFGVSEIPKMPDLDAMPDLVRRRSINVSKPNLLDLSGIPPEGHTRSRRRSALSLLLDRELDIDPATEEEDDESLDQEDSPSSFSLPDDPLPHPPSSSSSDPPPPPPFQATQVPQLPEVPKSAKLAPDFEFGRGRWPIPMPMTVPPRIIDPGRRASAPVNVKRMSAGRGGRGGVRRRPAPPADFPPRRHQGQRSAGPGRGSGGGFRRGRGSGGGGGATDVQPNQHRHEYPHAPPWAGARRVSHYPIRRDMPPPVPSVPIPFVFRPFMPLNLPPGMVVPAAMPPAYPYPIGLAQQPSPPDMKTAAALRRSSLPVAPTAMFQSMGYSPFPTGQMFFGQHAHAGMIPTPAAMFSPHPFFRPPPPPDPPGGPPGAKGTGETSGDGPADDDDSDEDPLASSSVLDSGSGASSGLLPMSGGRRHSMAVSQIPDEPLVSRPGQFYSQRRRMKEKLTSVDALTQISEMRQVGMTEDLIMIAMNAAPPDVVERHRRHVEEQVRFLRSQGRWRSDIPPDPFPERAHVTKDLILEPLFLGHLEIRPGRHKPIRNRRRKSRFPQVLCCLRGCSSRVSNRTRFCMKMLYHCKRAYLNHHMDKICDGCYFKDRYQNRKKR